MATRLLCRTVIDNPYVPARGGLFPTPKQAYFLTAPVLEGLFGGAAGGGKSDALLAGALQYADVPGYAALILRRSFADLALPGALMDRAAEWLAGTAARWNANDHRWTFPGGATLSFGYLETEADRLRYQSSEFAYVAFDELTQFTRTQYTYLFSRLRKPGGVPYPVRMRAATNPGGPGHDWVFARFPIDGHGGRPRVRDGRMFVPSLLDENPGLDKPAYRRSLAELDYVTRLQLEGGDWRVRPEGNLFRRDWFAGRTVMRVPDDGRFRRVRYWDLAATKAKPGKDPDWAVGTLCLASPANRVYVADVVRLRGNPREVEDAVTRTAAADGRGVPVRIEQEPGAASKLYLDSLASRQLAAYDVRGVPSLADKVTRARPASAACERGDVWLAEGRWNEQWLDEVCAFPSASHDDDVDSFTGGFNFLMGGGAAWGAEQWAAVMGS